MTKNTVCMYKIVAEKPFRVNTKTWRNKQCAIAYCKILQSRWANEKFQIKAMKTDKSDK
jgi:hypothetical protein